MSDIVSLDLPREQLIGWIAKQLALGVRSTNANIIADFYLEKSEKTFDLKKEIVRISKTISDKINSCISEEWHGMELQHTLLKAMNKRDRLDFQFDCIRSGNFRQIPNKLPTVVLTGEGLDELQVEASHRAEELLKDQDAIWSACYKEFYQDLKSREDQEKLIIHSLKSSSNDDAVASRRAALLEDYLQERFLLTQSRGRRRALEGQLRERVALLSAELHSVRDLARVKSAIDDSKQTEMNHDIEMNERRLEWELMEDEIRLERGIKEIDGKYQQKLERLKHEIASHEEVFKIENAFISEKDELIHLFKSEISQVRQDVKAIENAISQFKSFLRHADKTNRQNTKVLRE